MENINSLAIKNQKLRIILSQLTGSLGSGIFAFGIGLMILRETGSASSFGFSQIVGPVVSLLLLPFTGSIVDKYNRKLIVMIAQMSSIIAIFLFLMANSMALLPKLYLIYILLTILSISDLFLNTTYSAATILMVPKEEVQKVMSMKQIVRTISMIGSPILGATLYGLLSFEQFVIMEIASEIITLLIVLGMDFYLFRPNEDIPSGEENREEGILASFKEGLVFIRENNNISFMIIFAMFVNLTLTSINVGLPFIKINVFHFSDYEYGISTVPFALGMLLSGIILANRKDFDKPIFNAWKLCFALLFIIFATGLVILLEFSHFGNLIFMMAQAGVSGVLIGHVNTPIGVWNSKNIPPMMQGRVSNILSTGCQLLMPIGTMFFGALFDYPIRPDLIFIVASLIGIGIAYIMPTLLRVQIKEL